MPAPRLLTDEQVSAMKKRRLEGAKRQDIAKEFGVSERTVLTYLGPTSHSGRMDRFCKPATKVRVGSNPTVGTIKRYCRACKKLLPPSRYFLHEECTPDVEDLEPTYIGSRVQLDSLYDHLKPVFMNHNSSKGKMRNK